MRRQPTPGTLPSQLFVHLRVRFPTTTAMMQSRFNYEPNVQNHAGPWLEGSNSMVHESTLFR